MNPLPDPPPPPTEVALGRHAARRRAGVPTVSTLVGPTAAAAADAWRTWATAAGFRLFVLAATGGDGWVGGLLDGLAARHRWSCLVLDHLRRAAGLSPRPRSAAGWAAPPLEGRPTEWDVDALAAAAVARSGGDPAGTLAVAAAVARWPHESAGPSGPGGSPTARWPWPPDERLLRAVNGLLPAGGRPAVLLVPPDGTSADVPTVATWLAGIADVLARTAEAVPGWPLGVWATADGLAAYAREAPASRGRSLLLSGATTAADAVASVDAPTEPPAAPRAFATTTTTTTMTTTAAAVDPTALAERLRPVADEPVTLAQAVRGLAAAGASDAQIDAYAAAAGLRPRRDDAARSAAERLLFELLAAHPRTAGRFALNADPGFRFGPRAAEVDLLAADLRLAVEVDGYFHFADADAYRRDRRKDWALQRHGYAVVRVLADVVARTADVLDTVLAAVDDRLGGSPSAGVARDMSERASTEPRP